jgi:hypothetical protein
MKYTIALFALQFTLLITMTGCGERLIDYNIDTGTAVIEAYLLEGSNTMTVKAYSMEVYLKEGFQLSKPIRDLSININNMQMTETQAGTYSLDLGNDKVSQNETYNLLFTYNDKTVTATATTPAPIENLRAEPNTLTLSSLSYFADSADTSAIIVTWDDPDSSYYQVYIESPNTSDIPSLGIFGQRLMQPFRGNSHRATARDFRSAGTHRIYVYRVAKDYADLYEQVSSSDLANPVSAITNAFGIFTSLSVAQTQIYVYESDE